jgi:hypothetical protein
MPCIAWSRPPPQAQILSKYSFVLPHHICIPAHAILHCSGCRSKMHCTAYPNRHRASQCCIILPNTPALLHCTACRLRMPSIAWFTVQPCAMYCLMLCAVLPELYCLMHCTACRLRMLCTAVYSPPQQAQSLFSAALYCPTQMHSHIVLLTG